MVLNVGGLLAMIAWLAAAVAVIARGPDGFRGSTPFLACAGLALIPLVIWRGRGMQRAQGGIVRNEDALAMLRVGRYGEAATVLNELCHDARHAPALHALYVFNLGMASLYLGAIDTARALIERARASGWLGLQAFAHQGPHIALGHALCLALAGELDAARRALEEARAGLGEARRAATMLVQAVIDAREGREVGFDAEALRQAESCHMPAHIRALRLLEAFTRARGQGAYREDPRDGDVGAIGIHPGELDFLGARWPEMHAFLEQHGLLAA